MAVTNSSMPGARIGVDTGGTFTDFVSIGPRGMMVHKVRSTPADPARAILEGISDLAPGGSFLEVIHGSTVATNAVLERRGARVALVATEGFQDVLAIGRQTRPELYNFFVPPRRPLVEPRLIFGLLERLEANGQTLAPIDRQGLKRLVAQLTRGKVDIVAVCFLHSYANPSHEQRVANELRRAGLRVTASHEVLPEHREYERWSTTVLNAYVTPLIDRYLAKLEADLRSSTLPCSNAPTLPRSNAHTRLRVMQSNGGSISAAAARAQAVRTVLSGPAAGVVGARAVARAAGFHKIISFDMGGTSTDVSLVDKEMAVTTDSFIGDFPLRLPIIDVHSVGAGGGSIASIDTGGALRVGPQSAGAEPGPACYGTGAQFTLTDANLLLGRLDAHHFLGGRMRLDVARSEQAAGFLAARLKLSVAEVAEGVVRVANANMERALRVVSVQRGHDPRDFALLAFGGAGGMHACELAERLEVRTIFVPRFAGVLSALGLLLADVTKDYSASVLARSQSLADLRKEFTPLLRRAQKELQGDGFSQDRQIVERLIDVRYAGQSYEVTVPFSIHYGGEFHRHHERLYGYSDSARPTEIVNVRVKACGITEKPRLPRLPHRKAQPPAVKRRARFTGRTWQTAFYSWHDLSPGSRGVGPAVITGGEATVVIPLRFVFRVDSFGNVIIRRT